MITNVSETLCLMRCPVWIDLSIGDENGDPLEEEEEADKGCSSQLEIDPDVVGRCVLIVLGGGRGRRRLLRSMHAAGARLVCLSPVMKPWAFEFISQGDWIVAPAGSDRHVALEAVRKWVDSQSHAACSQGEHEERQRAAPLTIIDAILCYDEFGLQLSAALAQVSIYGPAGSMSTSDKNCKTHAMCSPRTLACLIILYRGRWTAHATRQLSGRPVQRLACRPLVSSSFRHHLIPCLHQPRRTLAAAVVLPWKRKQML